ncbi:type I restriction-modification enzyme R subunit C-terminal domain-containing protein [Actinomadura pelletieri]|nr:type I restriction-modification enzyme R subunit C-terminal domain-containing protein [Actinomadura pelletieri]
MTGESEQETRIRRIDPRLQRASWTPQDFRSVGESKLASAAAIREYPTASGPADYALCDDGHVRAVVEAKRLAIGTQEVLEQAKRYSRGIGQEPEYQGQYRVPFLYSSNGESIYFLDVRNPLNLSRQISGFHTPAALAELLARDGDAELAKLTDVPFSPILRPYQIEANQAVEQALRDRRRKMLLTMATGTGKTLVTVSEVYRLMKSGVARRVLFLVDRRALAAQAVQAFASFEPEPGLKFDKIYSVYSQAFQRSDFEDSSRWNPTVLPTSLLTDPKLGDSFVYVSTIQRMSINLFGQGAALDSEDEGGEDDATRLNIPINAFDLVIADECHRVYAARDMSTWRDTLDYFDAVSIGLTATPAAHTLAQFEHVAYRYDYERAVREGNLVDYDAVRIQSDVRINGVFLQAGDQIDNVDPETGTKELDALEDERDYAAADIEQKINVPDSNHRILQEIKRYAEEHEQEYGRFPKTLIFAAQDLSHRSHADQLVKQAREIFGRGQDFAAKITGKVDRPLQRIREFRNRPNPSIVVSVDLMSTGVDIPDLEFIVLLRPIKSRILFEQILGRGTRKGEQYPDKSHFVVFDCFDGTLLQYFRNTTGMTIKPPVSPSRTVGQIIEDIWQNRDRDYNVRALVKRLQRIDKQMSGDARELFSRFLVNGNVGNFAADLPRLVNEAFDRTMGILRDPDFQRLLETYPRAAPPFVIAFGKTDTVDSDWLIQAGAGREYRPDDYLVAFTEFVRTHETDLQALQILLHRPAEWNPAALKQLTQALVTAPEHFSEANLRRAFRAARHRDLVDIISMVKHAAEDSSPLLTAEERVNTAVAKVTEGRNLTTDEQQWMEYIRLHLVQNLSIEREDFEVMPILTSHGGWGRANRVFDGELEQIVADLNRELVAA